MIQYIDTHCHLDGEEFQADRDQVVQRACEAGCTRIFLPAIDLKSCQTVMDTCSRYPSLCYPMLGLHPEEVRADWREVLDAIAPLLFPQKDGNTAAGFLPQQDKSAVRPVAIGEVGLDFYWSREYEQEQMLAFEQQVRWSVETRLPLMIHCRKAQNEMVSILKKYARELPGGVFHCFTGNQQEARQLLEFDGFVLGIGGVLTFKKSHLPETLVGDNAQHPAVPLDRIVLETDAPYMAPVPMRGQRNEPAFVRHVITRLAEAYGVSEETLCQQTTANVTRVFGELK